MSEALVAMTTASPELFKDEGYNGQTFGSQVSDSLLEMFCERHEIDKKNSKVVKYLIIIFFSFLNVRGGHSFFLKWVLIGPCILWHEKSLSQKLMSLASVRYKPQGIFTRIKFSFISLNATAFKNGAFGDCLEELKVQQQTLRLEEASWEACPALLLPRGSLHRVPAFRESTRRVQV